MHWFQLSVDVACTLFVILNSSPRLRRALARAEAAEKERDDLRVARDFRIRERGMQIAAEFLKDHGTKP